MGFFADLDALLQVPTQLVRIEESLDSLHTKVRELMADVRVTQEALNDLDTSLDEVAANLAAHIEALNLPEGDLSALQQDVEALRALSAPAPAEEPPAGVNLREQILQILATPGWSDERKADEIIAVTRDFFMPLDSEMYDS